MMEVGVFNIINDNLQIIQLKEVIGGHYVQEWCALPYEKHPKGCPQIEKCVAKAKLWDQLVESPYFFIIRKFDLAGWAKQEHDKFPEWTEKQCRNSRLWQSHQDKLLRDDANEFCNSLPFDAVILPRPEKHGVNIFSTCRIHGLLLKKNPIDIVYRVAMVGKHINQDDLLKWFN